jgi:hypothetical protein
MITYKKTIKVMILLGQKSEYLFTAEDKLIAALFREILFGEELPAPLELVVGDVLVLLGNAIR